MVRITETTNGRSIERPFGNISQNVALSLTVPRRGLEPPSPCGRYHLKVVRLPISPPGQLRDTINEKPPTAKRLAVFRAPISTL